MKAVKMLISTNNCPVDKKRASRLGLVDVKLFGVLLLSFQILIEIIYFAHHLDAFDDRC